MTNSAKPPEAAPTFEIKRHGTLTHHRIGAYSIFAVAGEVVAEASLKSRISLQITTGQMCVVAPSLTAAQAREFAAALISCADDLDRLAVEYALTQAVAESLAS